MDLSLAGVRRQLDSAFAAVVPAAHVAQATVDMVLLCPAAHFVQVVAPAAASVFVTEPARHAEHGSVCDWAFWPGAQGQPVRVI